MQNPPDTLSASLAKTDASPINQKRTRQEKRAEALRQNLMRRKNAQRARDKNTA